MQCAETCRRGRRRARPVYLCGLCGQGSPAGGDGGAHAVKLAPQCKPKPSRPHAKAAPPARSTWIGPRANARAPRRYASRSQPPRRGARGVRHGGGGRCEPAPPPPPPPPPLFTPRMLARGECTFAPSPVAPRLGGAPSSRGDRTARPAPPPAPRPVRRLAPRRGRRGRAPGPQEGGAPCRLAWPPTRSGAQRRALCKRMEKGGTRLLHIADIIRRAEGGQHEAGGGCPATPRPTLPAPGALSRGLAAATTSQRRF